MHICPLWFRSMQHHGRNRPLILHQNQSIAIAMRAYAWVGRITAEKGLRVFCAVLMLSLGFAHQPVSAATSVPAIDESYRLPDGSFAEICFGHDGSVSIQHGGTDKGHAPVGVGLFCEACLLASSILLPVPVETSWLKTSFIWFDNKVESESGLVDRSSVERPRARAPPSRL